MKSDKTFTYFPMPYADEILYSIVARYHLFSGYFSVQHTYEDVFEQPYGQNILFPYGIDRLLRKLPKELGIKPETFINNHTILPLLKPFLTKERSNNLFESMLNEQKIIGYVKNLRTEYSVNKNLRFCIECAEEDEQLNGVAYWHRLHQIPGVFVCLKHNQFLCESTFNVAGAGESYGYYNLTKFTEYTLMSFSDEIKEKMIGLACDIEWVINKDSDYLHEVFTNCLYDLWLRKLNYRWTNGRTKNMKLLYAINNYYGKEFLIILKAYTPETGVWVKYLFSTKTYMSPIYHLLVIRFLAGSAEEFFTNPPTKESLLPFGEPPYPCRNQICPNYLKDVITGAKITYFENVPKGIFECPHCGYKYFKVGSASKASLYAMQCRVIDYGWLWLEKLKELLDADVSVIKMAKILHAGKEQIVTQAQKHYGLLMDSCYTKKEKPPEVNTGRFISCSSDFESLKQKHRSIWLSLISANPHALRSDLRELSRGSFAWLIANDRDWYESHSPPSHISLPRWSGLDDEYLEIITTAVGKIYEKEGKPEWVNYSNIARKTAISRLKTKLKSGLIPKTTAYVNSILETQESWQKRKLKWAVECIKERGEGLTFKSIRKLASVMKDKGRFNAYILSLL